MSTRRLVPASSASPAPPISFAAKTEMVNVSNRDISGYFKTSTKNLPKDLYFLGPEGLC